MVNDLHVTLFDAAGKAIAVKGPFDQAQEAQIYSAIEEFEEHYNLNSQHGMSLVEGGRIRVMKTVYEKEPTL